MFFENWGRLVSTGKFRLETACRGSKVTSLISHGKQISADYGYAAAA